MPLSRGISQTFEEPEVKSVKIFFKALMQWDDQTFTLLGSYFTLAFIFPPFDAQGDERERDLIIGLAFIVAIQVVHGAIEITSALERCKTRYKLSEKSCSLIKNIASQFCEAMFLSGIALGSASNIFENMSTLLRGLIAVLSIGTLTSFGSFIVACKERSESRYLAEKEPLLDAANARPFDCFAKAQHLKNLSFSTLTAFLVAKRFLIPIVSDFVGAPLNPSTTITLSIVYPLTAFVFNILPDHTAFAERHPRAKKLSRFGDILLIKNSEYIQLSFGMVLNIMALITWRPRIDISANTALTALLSCSLLYSIVKEAVYEVTSAANDIAPKVAYLLRSPLIIEALAQAGFWGMEFYGNNPYGIGAALVVGILAALPAFKDKMPASIAKHPLFSFFKELNRAAFYASTVLPWICMENAAMAYKSILVWPLAVANLIANDCLGKYSRFQVVAKIASSGLLGISLFRAMEQMIFRPLDVQLFPGAPYVACVAAGIARAAMDGGIAYRERNKVPNKNLSLSRSKSYGSTGELNRAQSDIALATRIDEVTGTLNSTVMLAIAIAQFDWLFRDTQDNHAEGYSQGTLLVVILILLLLYAHALTKNLGYHRAMAASEEGEPAGGYLCKKLTSALHALRLRGTPSSNNNNYDASLRTLPSINSGQSNRGLVESPVSTRKKPG